MTPEALCPKCSAYWDRRGAVILPLITSPQQFVGYADGVHQRHLRGESLEAP